MSCCYFSDLERHSSVSNCIICVANDIHKNEWDTFVCNHPDATIYHLYGWKRIISETYGHKTWYLIAREDSRTTAQSNLDSKEQQSGQLIGILPLIHIKSLIFGNKLISIPFADCGGILAKSREAESKLLSEAIRLMMELGVDGIELRNVRPIASLQNTKSLRTGDYPITFSIDSHKHRMLFPLPKNPEELMKSFKSKLRSQIRKPLKEKLISRTGGIELLNDFYSAFAINMRDLGSPVHSKGLIRNVLEEFPDRTRITAVYKDNIPIASSLMIGFKDMLENPWASSVKKYSRMSPNMLLYLRMLEYGSDNGFKFFNFGRSAPGEGTYNFKMQWGVIAEPLHWYFLHPEGRKAESLNSGKAKLLWAIRIWQKLPLSIATLFGPVLRKRIGL